MNIVSSLPIFYCEKQSVFFDQVEEHSDFIQIYFTPF